MISTGEKMVLVMLVDVAEEEGGEEGKEEGDIDSFTFLSTRTSSHCSFYVHFTDFI